MERISVALDATMSKILVEITSNETTAFELLQIKHFLFPKKINSYKCFLVLITNLTFKLIFDKEYCIKQCQTVIF